MVNMCIFVEYMCVQIWLKSAIGYRTFGKKHKGSFLRHPVGILKCLEKLSI